MRQLRHPLAVIIIACGALAACGSDGAPAVSGSSAVVTQAPADTSGAVAAQLPADGDEVDCIALKDTLANIAINWQVVIGLTNSPASEWSQIPLGSLTEFGNQLAVATAALGSDAAAAEALAFMAGANDIVARGMGGDETAQADLIEYMGADVVANVSKQIPISMAYQNTGCD